MFIILVLYIVYLFIKSHLEFSRFKKFLIENGDNETLDKIGARYHGIPTNFQCRVPIDPMEERLKFMYCKTNNIEYWIFLKQNSKNRTKIIALYICTFFLFCYLITVFDIF